MKILKQIARYIIKAPQRKIIGYSTLYTDFKGLLKWIFYPKPTNKISICVGVFNKWNELNTYLIPSLLKAENAKDIELCISDSGSIEATNEIQKLKEKWPYQLKTEIFPQAFTRAKVFNRAIALATNPWIMVIDADMNMPKNILKTYKFNVRKGLVWFPICQWQIQKTSLNWRWFTEGTGIFGAHITDFLKAEKLNETYTTWGLEDWDFYFTLYKKGIATHRTKYKNLYHNWHPSLKPHNFKKWF